MSNHSPIYSEFDIGVLNLQMEQQKAEHKVSWCKADSQAKENFRNVFEDKLNQIQYRTECSDIHCTSLTHAEHLEDYTLSVLQAMEAAARECLPITGACSKRQKGTPGWNEYVKPFSDESRFWFDVWSSAGKPRSGELYAIMKI